MLAMLAMLAMRRLDRRVQVGAQADATLELNSGRNSYG